MTEFTVDTPVVYVEEEGGQRREARIVAIKDHRRFPLVAVFRTESGEESSSTFGADGTEYNDGGYPRLKKAPETVSRFVNLYDITGHATRDTADLAALSSRQGVAEITYEDGKPVSVVLHSDI